MKVLRRLKFNEPNFESRLNIDAPVGMFTYGRLLADIRRIVIEETKGMTYDETPTGDGG